MSMQFFSTLAANTASLDARLGEGLGLMAVGMTIVFLALVVIGSLVWVTQRLLHEVAEPVAEEAQEPSPIVQGTPPAATDNDGVSPQLVAVLTAAAMAVVQAPLQITRVRHLQPQDIQGWVHSARAGSHRQPAFRKGRT